MRYGQPFCIIGSKGKFKGAKYGYLPALELPVTKDNNEEIEKKKHKATSGYKQIYS